MAEGKKRKVHSAEFKAKVGLEAVRGVRTLNEIAQEYGVHPVGWAHERGIQLYLIQPSKSNQNAYIIGVRGRVFGACQKRRSLNELLCAAC